MVKWTSSFYLVPKELEDLPVNLAARGILTSCPVQKMPNELFNYIWDTLCWIPAQPGSFNWMEDGFPRVRADGGRVAEKVFSAWLNLFEAGPVNVVISCGTSYTVLNGKKVWKPRKLEITRSELVEIFTRLRQYSLSVQEGTSLLYFLDWSG
jgi:hypothetical protein